MQFLSKKAAALTPYVAGVQPSESGWVKLNTNENPYPPSPKVTEILTRLQHETQTANLRLYPDTDSTELKTAIAAAMPDLGLMPENIFCGNSSDEVLALAFQAFFSGKENVLSPDISYGFYPVWGQMYDVGFNFKPLAPGFSIRTTDYKNSNGVVIANPNAPTSLALPLALIGGIVADNPGGVVLIDEAYIDFATEQGVQSAADLMHGYENVLVVRTFSKAHSLAGLRVGYAIGSPKLIDGLCHVRDAFNSYPLGLLAQKCAAAAISDTAYLQETTRKIINTREKLIGDLRGIGYTVLNSQANFIFIKPPAPHNAADLYKHLYNNKILVRHWNKPRIDNFLRVTIGTPQEMEKFLEGVKNYA